MSDAGRSHELTLGLTSDALDALADRVAAKLAARQPVTRRWLTVDQAADYIGAKRQRIYDLRAKGRLVEDRRRWPGADRPARAGCPDRAGPDLVRSRAANGSG